MAADGPGAGVDDAAGQLGLVGGHVEDPVAEAPASSRRPRAGRRPRRSGLDLDDVALTYLESELFTTDAGAGQVTVAFVAAAPADQEPVVADPAELTAVGWWSPEEAGRRPAVPGLAARAAPAGRACGCRQGPTARAPPAGRSAPDGLGLRLALDGALSCR